MRLHVATKVLVSCSDRLLDQSRTSKQDYRLALAELVDSYQIAMKSMLEYRAWLIKFCGIAMSTSRVKGIREIRDKKDSEAWYPVLLNTHFYPIDQRPDFVEPDRGDFLRLLPQLFVDLEIPG
eukprot:Trichotokara_eunicae@DN8001_c0_g1_i1.p1